MLMVQLGKRNQRKLGHPILLEHLLDKEQLSVVLRTKPHITDNSREH